MKLKNRTTEMEMTTKPSQNKNIQTTIKGTKTELDMKTNNEVQKILLNMFDFQVRASPAPPSTYRPPPLHPTEVVSWPV